jgi:hypothetical protein
MALSSLSIPTQIHLHPYKLKSMVYVLDLHPTNVLVTQLVGFVFTKMGFKLNWFRLYSI